MAPGPENRIEEGPTDHLLTQLPLTYLETIHFHLFNHYQQLEKLMKLTGFETYVNKLFDIKEKKRKKRK